MRREPNPTQPCLPHPWWLLGVLTMLSLSISFGTPAKPKSISSSSTYWNLSYNFLIPNMKTFTQANSNYNLFCQSPKCPPVTFKFTGNAAIKTILTVTFLALNSELAHFLLVFPSKIQVQYYSNSYWFIPTLCGSNRDSRILLATHLPWCICFGNLWCPPQTESRHEIWNTADWIS